MKKIIVLAVLQLIFLLGYGQIQQGFKYQAVVRDAEGKPLAEKPLQLKITLEANAGGTVHFTEDHNLTTNQFGLISIVVGEGTPTHGSLSSTPWKEGNITLKAEIKINGAGAFTPLGESVLYPVPYALYAESGPDIAGTKGQTLYHDGTGWVANSNIYNANANVGVGIVTPTEKLEVMGNIKAHGKLIGDVIEINQPAPFEEPIFVVRNSLGKIVFAVYESGIRMYVDDAGKGNRGGFVVGGFSDQTKETGKEFFRVTPDSVRVNIRKEPHGKGNRGGFVVGGFSDQTKKGDQKYLFIGQDSSRIYVDDTPTKGNRGGFVVGGFSDQTKKSASSFLDLTPNNYFIGHKAGRITKEGAGNFGKYNSFMGYESGFSNTTGYFNTFMGYKTGHSNTTGAKNVFIGNSSGLKNTSGGNNVFIGNEAGLSNTNGVNNVFLGNLAGYTNNGSNNVFLGTEAGRFNTSGTSNAFMGYFAGRANTTGVSNVFIGNNSGLSNTSGRFNAFMGYNSGQANTTGNSNVFIGNEAGFKNSTGENNVFLGNYAGYSNNAWHNVFIGNEAGYSNTSGYTNTFIGFSAGKNNTEGGSNLFLGNSAGLNNISGKDNLIIGNDAGSSNKVAYNLFFIGNQSGQSLTDINSWGNTFVGHRTGSNATTSINSTYLGFNAGSNNISGTSNTFLGCNTGQNGTSSYNVFVGSYAGNEIGDGNNDNVIIGTFAGYHSSGSKNVFIGKYAGYQNTGTGNVLIGHEVDFNQSGFSTFSNILMIDNHHTYSPLIWGDFNSRNLVVNGNNTNNTSNRTFFSNGSAGGTTAWNSASDFRLKKDVETILNPIEKVLGLRGVSYRWKDNREEGVRIGFIAQEAIEVLPEVVSEGETYSMQYAPITALLVEAIKEQQKEINALKAELEATKEQKKEIDILKAEIEAIKALIGK